MGNCARFGAVSCDGLPREKDRRERVCVCVCVAMLSGGELDGGRLATMWVSPQYTIFSRDYFIQSHTQWNKVGFPVYLQQ